MSTGIQTCGIAIAGASSLRGKELKTVIEDSAFPADEIRLFDEEAAAGTLTEAGGEPALIQTVDEDSFRGVRFAFFAGSGEFARAHGEAARNAGANVIDMSGGLADAPGARPWVPSLDAVLPPPLGQEAHRPGGSPLLLSPSSPAIVAVSLAAALGGFSPERIAIVFLRPVSERGQEGIEELESQTVKLLSFQPIGGEVFDAQVAFNLLERYGGASGEKLCDRRADLAREVKRYLAGRAPLPALALLQAPVFYSHAFLAYAEFPRAQDPRELERRLAAAGFKFAAADGLAPSNVTVAGENRAVLGTLEPDALVGNGLWLWGAADNLRLAASNALRIAEKLLAN